MLINTENVLQVDI